MGASYQVSLSAFEGPFDLLLHLVARRQLDIHDIPLAEITDDYLNVVRRPQAVDLERTGGFLVVAATLLELKAARLLPVPEPEVEEAGLEARDLLYARLLEYRAVREGAAWMGQRLQGGARYLARRAATEDRFTGLRPAVRIGVDAAGLARVADRVLALAPPAVVDLEHVAPPRRTVDQLVADVTRDLARLGGRARLHDLLGPDHDVADVVVTFLALLELYRCDVVDLEQAAGVATLAVVAREPLAAPEDAPVEAVPA